MQLTIAQRALRICSTYHLVAISLPHGQVVDDYVTSRSRRMPSMFAVEWSDFLTRWET